MSLLSMDVVILSLLLIISQDLLGFILCIINQKLLLVLLSLSALLRIYSLNKSNHSNLMEVENSPPINLNNT
jgi:hypothetical protein